jgi:hypothetical protein
MEDIFYFTRANVRLEHIKEIAESLGYRCFLTSRAHNTWLNIYYGNTHFWQWEELKREDGDFDGFETPQLEVVTEYEPHAAFGIGHHIESWQQLSKFLQFVLTKYEGWIGRDDGTFEVRYNAYNVADFEYPFVSEHEGVSVHLTERLQTCFTLHEYKKFVQHYSALEESETFHGFLEKTESLDHQYRARLPVYLLARCPICGGRVHEAIDTYSLNGPGWKGIGGRGFGWYGPVSKESSTESEVSYDAECRHAKIVSVMVNLNGIQPDDVTQEVHITSERPFVMSPVLNLDKTYAVIHSLPIDRFDDDEPQRRYTAYFVTYFTDVDRRLYDRVMQPAHEGYGLVAIDWATYDLLPWVKRGKLYWLDKNDPDLPLRNEPARDFPYANVKGGEGLWVIRNGRMTPYYSSHPVSWSGGEWRPEPGLLRRLINKLRRNE